MHEIKYSVCDSVCDSFKLENHGFLRTIRISSDLHSITQDNITVDRQAVFEV